MYQASYRVWWAGVLLAVVARGGVTAQEPPKPARTEQIEALRGKIAELQEQLDALTRAEQQSEAEASGEQDVLADWIKSLSWRSIGPANMGGRIVALAVVESDPNTFFVATASGGLLRSDNHGITFKHLFDREATVSIGDVAVAPSDPNVVWVGTGENNARNSVSYGDGVYKSTDGGKTWTNMGLRDSYQIGRIVIHPTDPNTVYVGALGRLYGPNPERGLFKTTDGGKTWEKVLYIDDKTGVIDIRMHPADPQTLIVATYERQRGEYDVGDPVKKWGPGSGLHKTTDGGKTWKKLTAGLPTVALGRIGLDWYRKDPNVVFAIIESEKIGHGPARPEGAGTAYMGVSGEDRDGHALLTSVVPDGPAARAGLRPGDLVLALGDEELKSYEDLIDAIQSRKADEKVRLKVRREGKDQEFELTFGKRPAGREGGDPNRPFGATLGGQRENVQDRQGPEGFQTGGLYRSADAGETWTRINSINPRPFYFSQVRVDPNDEKLLYVLGIALYRSTDGGKTFKPDGGRNVHADHHALWIDPRDGRHAIVGCDGGTYITYDRMENWDHLNTLALGQFYDVAVDTRRNYRAFGGLQDNGTWGGPTRTRSGTGPINEDWINISGGDGFQTQVDPEDPDLVYATSQYGVLIRRNLRTGETARLRVPTEKDIKLRWNWNTPILLSSHNPRIYLTAGNYVFRSLNRGEDLRRISPQLARTEQGSATALAESPRNPGVYYVGTDDGYLWVTKDGGREWNEISGKVGLKGPRCVATIEASKFAEGRVYVAFDAHRQDDDEPYLFVSEDFGQSWKRIDGALPRRGSTRCLREDVENPDLLYAGTEFSIYATIDRGAHWHRINANLPTVAVHEVAVHPTAGEIVAATHGRSLWVLDISALRQIKPEVFTAKATLFKPPAAIRWLSEPSRGRTNRRFVGENPSGGARIYYTLTAKVEKASLRVLDAEGRTVRELRVDREPGLHVASWDLARVEEGRRPAGSADRGADRPAGESGEARPEPRTLGPLRGTRGVAPGTYRIVLNVDGTEHSQTIRVERDPIAPPVEVAEDEPLAEELDAEEPDELIQIH